MVDCSVVGKVFWIYSFPDMFGWLNGCCLQGVVLKICGASRMSRTEALYDIVSHLQQELHR